MEKFISILEVDEIDVQRECLYVLSNTTLYATSLQIETLFTKGLISSFSNILKFEDWKMVELALSGITNILDCDQRQS